MNPLLPYPDVSIGLCFAIEDEWVATCTTIAYAGVKKVAIVQSGSDNYEHLLKTCSEMKAPHIKLTAMGCSTWERPVQTLVRSYQTLFNIASSWPVDYVVFLTGDTVMRHVHGIYAIIEQMQKESAEIGCIKASEVHKADWTEDQLQAGEGGGREGERDFKGKLFIVRRDCISKINLSITNKWSIEQCLGDASDLQQCFIPADFQDGVIFNANQCIQVTGLD